MVEAGAHNQKKQKKRKPLLVHSCTILLLSGGYFSIRLRTFFNLEAEYFLINSPRKQK